MTDIHMKSSEEFVSWMSPMYKQDLFGCKKPSIAQR